LIGQTVAEVPELNGKLPEFMVDKSSAFTSRQRRKCRQLVKAIVPFWEIFHVHLGLGPLGWMPYQTPIPSEVIENAEKYRVTELESIIPDFETGSIEEQAYRRFDSYLTSILVETSRRHYLFLDNKFDKQARYEVLHLVLEDSEKVERIIQAIEAVRENL
jgi:hypothetical protein